MRAPVACTRPSTLAGAFEDGRGLFPYIASTTLRTIAENDDLMTRLSLINGEDWRAFKPLYEEAERRGGKREASDGTNIHAVVQALAAGYDVSRVPDPARSDGLAIWNYIRSRGWRVVASERFVANLTALPEPIAGTLDLMVEADGAPRPFVVDAKSVSNPSDGKYSALKWSIQTGCYALGDPVEIEGEPPRDRWGRPLVSPDQIGHWPFEVETSYALILEVHRGHAAVQPHWVDLERGIQYAAMACAVRKLKKNAPANIFLEDPLA